MAKKVKPVKPVKQVKNVTQDNPPEVRYNVRRAPDSTVRDAMGTMLPSHSQQIAAAEFKARCLELMEEVRERGSEYVITKRGEPVARLVPLLPPTPFALFGSMKGGVTVLGDITAPIDERWDALDE